MVQKIQKNIVLGLVFLLAVITFSACSGTDGEEPGEMYFGIRFTQHKSEIQNVQQIVCGQDHAWAITAVKNAPIYQLEYGDITAGVTELEWQQEANESLINIAEQDGTLYADIWSGEENALVIRKYTSGVYWSDLMRIENVDESWKNIGEGFFVDSSGNVYLAGRDTVTRFHAEGQAQSTEYKLGGRPFFFRETESGSVECLMNGQNKLTLYTLTENGAEKKWSLETALSGNAYSVRSSEEGTFCVAAGKEILFLDGSSGTLLAQPFLLSSIGVPSVLAGVYDAQEKALRLYSIEDNSLSCRLLESLDSPDQRIELIYGTYGYGAGMEGYQDIIEAIVRFNQENEKYYITTKNYGLEDGREKLQLDMAAGNAPDIIDLRDLDYYESYVRNGYLEDLRPHIEQSGLNDDLLWNVLDLFKEDGGLYLMPPKLMLYCILLNPELEPVPVEDWNMETFLELIEKNQWEKDIYMDNGNPYPLLKFLTVCRQEEFLDFDRKEAHFETAEFLDMLALCREYAGHNWQCYDFESQIHNNLLNNGGFFGFDTYLDWIDIYGREYPVYGYPTSSGSSYPIGVYFDCCGIYAGSGQKEGAWEFIKSLLEEDYQISRKVALGFSVRKSYSETMAEKAKEIDFMVNGEVVYINDNEISILKDIIYGDHFFRGWIRNDIWNVIEEESAAYFAGDKSAEDVAHIIQSRVEIILNE